MSKELVHQLKTAIYSVTAAKAFEAGEEIESLREQLAIRDAEISGLKSKLFDLTKQRDALSRIADTLEQERDELRERINTARDYLERLACLGNGDRHGNSNGNCMAIEALAATEPSP